MRIILYSSMLCFLILFPSDTAVQARQAMQIWGQNLVPFLFPYMVFSRLLFHQLLTLRFPIIPVTMILGILGGSPSGAILITSSANHLSPRTLNALTMLCSSVSPMFIMGTLRVVTDNPLLCSLLLVSHWFSCALCSLTIWVLFRNSTHCTCTTAASAVHTSFSNPIAQSIDALMQVGGCVICFSVLAGMLRKILHANDIVVPVLHAALEISGGAHAICQGAFSSDAKAILLSATLGFNGLSIIVQNHSFLQPLGISIKQMLVFSAMRAVFSAACMSIILIFI